MLSIKMSEGGRVVVPVEIRRALGVNEGDTLLGELRDGDFVLTTRRAQLARARQLFQQYCPPQPNRSLVDEFLAERRAEAGHE